MKSRIVILFALLSLVWLGLVFRGVSLKLFPSDRLVSHQKRQFEKSIELKSKRGAILDLNKKELAVSVPSYSLFADPRLIKNSQKTARAISKKLEISRSKLNRKIKNKKRRFVWVKRNLTKSQMSQIKKLKIRGLGFIEEPQRVYPHQNLLSQVLGFTGREGFGLEGLEHEFERELSGTHKKFRVPRDARGRPLISEASHLFQVPDGKDLQLTLDSEIQYFLEQQLDQAVEKHDASGAIGVVLDVATSEVVALANVPTFNLNQANQYSASFRKNRAVADAFEPGSTMKTFVVAAGLEQGLMKPSTVYDCEGGRLRIGRHWISEADSSHKFNKLSVSEILAKSSNVGSAKIGFDVTAEKLYPFLQSLGFGERLSIRFPGLTSGSLQPLPWGKHLLSNISFGHGVSANALQVANAYAAIANNGKWNEPTILKGFWNPITGEFEESKRKKTRTVFSKKVAELLTLMLTQAVSEQGTGASARVSGYPVAGKTGTAQKVDTVRGGYIKGHYISSFAGFLPSNQPKYVIYVAVDSPQNKYYGSEVAAPIFSQIGSFLMRKDQIPPVLISSSNVISNAKALSKLKQQKALVKIQRMQRASGGESFSDLIGLSLRKALVKVQGRAEEVRIKGSGTVAKTKFVKPNKNKMKRKIILYLE